MMNLPNLPVLNKIMANNSRIAPNAQSNNTVVDKKNFSMAHPQKLPQDTLTSLLGMLDFNSASTKTNGVIKGNTVDGGKFHLTPGVLKFTKGHGNKKTPPPNYPEYPTATNQTQYPANQSSGSVSGDTGGALYA